uniref:PI3K/PI4K catalytic domain-containing protein n=1 Tax=Lotharella oceanica TaxID=641309 RepID=A0A7S2TGF9_9EUKA
MAYVMGGEKYDSSERYKRFVKLCCDAYNIIRANGHLFITLFRAMKLAGMPELTSDEDIMYLREQLRFGDTDSQASKYFKSQITLCVLEPWRRWDNAIHNIIHGKG